MCGICGILKAAGDHVDERDLTRMRDTLAHRGPEGAGNWTAGHVGLAHRRLRIVDLTEAAGQPISNESDTLTMVFNGEIYNHRELRAELDSKGHQFRSASDAEVVVHAYEQWGMDCLCKFNGMFAFALYDATAQSVWLVRDRLGIKPLHFWSGHGQFLFASEIKAFWAVPQFHTSLNHLAAAEHLLCRTVAGSETLYAGVHHVPAGHWLTIDRHLAIRQHRYWTIPIPPADTSAPEPARNSDLVALIDDSVRLESESQVPLGNQLSGGLDSGLLAALTSQHHVRGLSTFSVGFKDGSLCELTSARHLAGHIHADSHHIICGQDRFGASLARATWHLDEPMTHPNSVGLYWLSHDAKPLVTVLISGEGADELFGGYTRYRHLQRAFQARKWLGHSLNWLPPLRRPRRLQSLQKCLADAPEHIVALSSARCWRALAPCIDPATCRVILENRCAILDPVRHHDWLTQSQYYDCHSFLPNLLARQDRMAMAHAIEVRVPYLDQRLVEFAFRLPLEAKLHHGQTKVMLRQAAHPFLPESSLRQPKIGFEFPIADWLANSDRLRETTARLEQPDSLSCQLLGPTIFAQLKQPGRLPADQQTAVLWNIVAFEVWYQEVFRKPGEIPPLPWTA